MFVKKIVIHGFKSFADKTQINFSEGVTAIVGPNGCGKSNICDAFRWALGEQRARQLRGTRMEDVIFNGTETRHQQGMAEVTIMIDNITGAIPLDYREVVITRRLYRSGDSDYQLNRVSCRLRDIIELFMDTGLSKSAYSVIGQGQMDLVLSSKPEERRFLFEEAAGIVKYKTRQRTAMRKLDAAENNLLRLDDVIREVRRQMRSMRRQASAARRYKEQRDLLRQLEIRTAYASYEELTRDSTALETKLIAVQQEREGHGAALAAAEADRESLGGRLLETDRELAAGRGRLHDLETQADQLERRVSVLRERLTANEQVQKRATADISEVEERAGRLEGELDGFNERLSGAETEAAALADELVRQESNREDVRNRQRETARRADQLRDKSAELARTRSENVTSRDRLRYELDRLRQERDAVTSRLTELEKLVREAETGVKEAQGAADDAVGRVSQTEEELARHQENISRIVDELAATDQRLEEVRDEHSRAESNLESLKDLHERFEGYYEGARTILTAHKEGHKFARGVHGPVADLITVPREYERSVESILGDRAQWIVTGTVSDARACIDHLADSGSGRATMLPLDQIDSLAEPAEIDPAISSEQGVLKKAADLVECADEYRNLVDRLLAGTLVVDTVDDALAIRDRYAGRALPDMVAADGTVIGKLGTIYGGSASVSGRGLVGRGAEIEQLAGTVAELDARLAEAEQLRESQRGELDRVRAEYDTCEARLRQLAVRAAEARRDLETREQDSIRVKRQLDEAQQGLDRINKSQADIERQAEQAESRLAEIDGERDNLDAQIEAVADELRELREREEECNNKVTDARIGKAEGEHKVVSIRAEIARVQQLRDEIGERKELRIKELETARKAAADITEEIHETELAVAEVITERDKARAGLVTLENGRQEMLDAVETLDSRLKELRGKVQEVQSQVHSLELDLTQKRDRLDGLQELIESEYDVRLYELTKDEVGTDEMSDEQRNAEIARLRDRLASMGSVNLMAIDEQTDLEKRLEFLTTQRDDLVKARTALKQIVDKFNRVTEQMFLQTFEDVRRHFHDLFRALFGGGQGRLSLLDEENVLESGIEVAVRPPGKKMQALELFSGGERAMIAIALLFAIFKCKPSPFCFLDEVDAPLDDANIGRFLDMLADFSRATQFVIITHNKITMERADVLYGVTMAEQGVSQVISTRLAEVDEISA